MVQVGVVADDVVGLDREGYAVSLIIVWSMAGLMEGFELASFGAIDQVWGNMRMGRGPAYLLYYREHPGLCVVVAVCANALDCRSARVSPRCPVKRQLTRSTLSGLSSARYARISPKRGSSGAWGTVSAGKLVGATGEAMMWSAMFRILAVAEEDVDVV